MKMLPVQLSLNPPLGLWSDVLWRCPPSAPSQLAELKTQLPASLPTDPRLWSREDVTVFLRFCEREFDLPKLDYDLFQMNGKALCLLTRADFGHRCPGAGDVLHNVLQMLIIESHMMQWHLPNSPVTPTSRFPLSPHSHPPTPTWPPIATPEGTFPNSHMHHFMAPNSVTLSPPPSVDSQASSPPQNAEQMPASVSASISASNSSSSSSNCSASSSSVATAIGAASLFVPLKRASTSSSNHSDSDDESLTDTNNSNKGALTSSTMSYSSSPPTTPILKEISQTLTQQMTNNFVNSWNQAQSQVQIQKLQLPPGSGGSASAPTTPSFMQPVKREFFPENSEPNTNGRLLWDFLQQLLNDRNQKYSDLIAWKCRDTGVFKIVDPAGLAKLWGIQKNHLSMNYDKMSRALRYYYRVNILRKVQGERHCYQFLRNPTELKNIKNISLLRQSVNSSTNITSNGSNANSFQGNVNLSAPSTSSSANQSSALIVSTSSSASSSSGASSGAATSASKALQNGSWHGRSSTPGPNHSNVSPVSPQSPSTRNGNGGAGSGGSGGGGGGGSSSANHPINLPTVAAVAAAAAAAYGPPPSSPLFMHAINGAFHYLSSNSNNVTPNSPILPSNADDKFLFHPLKSESMTSNCSVHESAEDMKPTDLSIAGGSTYLSNSEKRSYNNDCYPLIRNGDGLTTIKLIRYNDNTDGFKSPSIQQYISAEHPSELSSSSSSTKQCHLEHSTPNSEHSMDTTSNENQLESNSNQYENNLPTDLRK